MTERLYYADSHLVEFEARVLSVATVGERRVGVRLDRTAFYPTGGGQPTDTGRLGAARVIECVDLEEEGVLHLVEGEPPAEGSNVRGVVDWPRRLDHIQQHTGQHILSQAFVQLFDAETRSFRMMTDASEIDVDLSEASDEKIERAIERANEIIWADREILIHNVNSEEAGRLPLRKESAREGGLRVIEIAHFDYSPCGGTHARRTGEVGLIAASHWERAKGLVRVTFVAGGRALADYRNANRTARRVAALFSVARDEATASVERLQEENKGLLRRLRALEETAARAEARDLLEETTKSDDRNDLRVVARVFPDRDAESLRSLAVAIAAHQGAVALLGSRDGETARLVFARSADAPGDMNILMRAACQTLAGRGGGRPDMAQGGGRDPDKLDEAVAAAARQLQD